jgi:hypothetical protein
MCSAPNETIMSAVDHETGANKVMVPTTMNAAPMTGTLRTE